GRTVLPPTVKEVRVNRGARGSFAGRRYARENSSALRSTNRFQAHRFPDLSRKFDEMTGIHLVPRSQSRALASTMPGRSRRNAGERPPSKSWYQNGSATQRRHQGMKTGTGRVVIPG